MKVVSCTSRGLVRKLNEDSLYAQGNLLMVADGMGGYNGGEVASRVAVDSVAKELTQMTDAGQLMLLVDRAIQSANQTIYEMASADGKLSGMGTTLTLCHVAGGIALVAHVGDSRAYLFRNGRLSRLTMDHSLVEELVRSGYITREQAAVHPHRHVVTRALGMEGLVHVDQKRVAVQAGDRLLLCSDGLTLHMEDALLESTMAQGADMETTVDQLLNEALTRGGEDNITLVLALIEEGAI